jgi:hypothetical protein
VPTGNGLDIRGSHWVQLVLVVVGSGVAADTKRRHFSVARLVLTVTFGSAGSKAG